MDNIKDKIEIANIDKSTDTILENKDVIVIEEVSVITTIFPQILSTQS